MDVDICGLRKSGTITITNSHERDLALELLGFGEALDETAEDFRPNRLTEYLFALATKFARFYEQCPVLSAPSAIRQSRLMLCDLTARVLERGLSFLGIAAPERL